jgi:hypothetical protein
MGKRQNGAETIQTAKKAYAAKPTLEGHGSSGCDGKS